MKPVLLVVAFSLACLSIAQHAGEATRQLIGTWKYDVSSMKLELNAKGKASMRDPKAKESMAGMEKQLASSLKTMTLAFKSNRSVVISSGGKTVGSGTWTLHGRDVNVVMTNARQATPRMTLAKDGKTIHTVYSDPNFGEGKIDLVKKS